MAARKRTLVSLAAGALVAPLLPFAASPAFAAGEDTPPPPRSVADFCANVPESFDPFTDIEGNTFEDNIRCLAASEITLGGPGQLPDSQYGPGLPVTRDAMASFIARLIDKADELDTGDSIRTLPAFDGTVTPTDVAPGSVHAPAIDRLFEAGVVAGGPGGRPATQYGPSLEVSRAQMASFIRNALQYMTGDDVTSTKDFFTDDENVAPHEPRINAVAELAIAVGDGRDLYNPPRPVSRDQMSGFLTRTLAVLEEVGAITPLAVGDEEPEPGDTAVTDAPDLVSAEIVGRTGSATSTTTAVDFTFDEEVTAGGVEAGSFLVYAFDGEQFVADSATRTTGETATVRAVFPVESDRAGDLTVATVDAAAVEDSDGNTNPIGDAALGDGVTLSGGRTAAPDVLSIGGFRATATGTTTAVDFTFDQNAFVVDPAEGQFQLVFPNGTDLEGTPTEDADGAFVGDGTRTITVDFEGRLTATQVSRGVVLQGTVSDEEQVANGLPIVGIGDTPEGSLNPLQVTDTASGGATTLPDLVSAELVRATGTDTPDAVEFTFDEEVAVEDEALFHVYDDNGEQFDGTGVAAGETDGDTTVVVTFEPGVLDAVVGASVDEGAVNEGGTGARANQEDEVGVTGMEFDAGTTVGPDLLEVTRDSATEGVTLRFTFDDDAAEVATGFFFVDQSGTQTALEDCAQSATTDEENVVECTVSAEDDPLTLTVDESAGFDEVGEAVVATVDDGAVTDDDGNSNPEGAALLQDA